MKLEVINLTSTEQRVLLLFDTQRPSSEDAQVRSYLQDNSLQPRREYQETRDTNEYDVYYFGHCYLKGHLEHLVSLASGPSEA